MVATAVGPGTLHRMPASDYGHRRLHPALLAACFLPLLLTPSGGDSQIRTKRFTLLADALRQPDQVRILELERDCEDRTPRWADLARLKRLRTLRLRGCEMPARWQLPQSLRELEIGTRSLTAVPSGTTDLEELRVLTISAYRTKSIPDDVGRLTKLRVLRLDTDHLVRVPASIGELAELRLLHIKGELREIPASLGRLTKLRGLQILQRGTAAREPVKLPSSIGGLLRLRDLKLCGKLELPEEAGNLRSLRAIELCGGESLPETVKKWDALETAKVRYPVVNLGLAPALRSLEIGTVDRKHPLPEDHGKLDSLETLTIWHGETAESDLAIVDRMTNLRRFEVYTRRLKHLRLSNLKRLRYLKVRGDQWRGIESVGAGIGNLTELQELHLPDSKLTDLPDEIGRLAKLRVLCARRSRLGALPESIGELEQLRVLDLHHGYLGSDRRAKLQMRSLPESIGKLRELEVLNLTNLKLEVLPESLGNLAKLRFLFLSGNWLPALPESIGNLNRLELLFLNCTGSCRIPPSIGRLRALRVFYMPQKYTAPTNRSVRWSKIPEAMRRLENLCLLGVGETGISEFPTWLGDLAELRVFDFSGNAIRALPARQKFPRDLRAGYLYRNQIRSIPPSFVRAVPRLARLGFDDNPIPARSLKRLRRKFPSALSEPYYDFRNCHSAFRMSHPDIDWEEYRRRQRRAESK